MILSETSALAASTPLAWDTLAASLGCSQKVSQGERLNGAHYLTEYLPRDQSIAHFTRRFTVTVFPLSDDLAEAALDAEEILESMAATAHLAGAAFRECVTMPAPFGDSVFFDYSSGDEHIAASAIRIAPNLLTVYQLTTSNGAIPSLADVLVIRSLTSPK